MGRSVGQKRREKLNRRAKRKKAGRCKPQQAGGWTGALAALSNAQVMAATVATAVDQPADPGYGVAEPAPQGKILGDLTYAKTDDGSYAVKAGDVVIGHVVKEGRRWGAIKPGELMPAAPSYKTRGEAAEALR